MAVNVGQRNVADTPGNRALYACDEARRLAIHTIKICNSQNIHHERKRLYRMARKVKRGDATREKADECYDAWKSYASKGNTYKVIQRMDAYYKDLWR